MAPNLLSKVYLNVLIVIFCALSPYIVEDWGYCADWSGNINAILGFKTLKSDEWSPAYKGGEVGFLADFKKNNWPVSVAVDFLYSRHQQYLWQGAGALTTANGYGAVTLPENRMYEFEPETYEFNLGIRKIWNFEHFRPFVGGGLAWVDCVGKIKSTNEYFDLIRIRFNGEGFGGWIGVGSYLQFGPHINVGMEFRYSTVEVKIDDITVNGGGEHFRVVLGYSF